MDNFAATMLTDLPPRIGDLVEVRSRRWLVDGVERPHHQSSLVSLACADDDAQGQTLEVYWEMELDRLILKQENWGALGAKGFDQPRRFGAFLHTLRWDSVTATDPNLFQAPFRAGIKIDAYQMEPLRKALRLARVNLFIADDTGLGKTIEAGLIARELLLRKKARTVVVAAPASVLEQWKMELEERFGLVFVILDRAYLSQMRRERGFSVNPWRTHQRFIVSHSLLIDPAYADPLRVRLGSMSPGSLLILDEAHHAAPSSGGRYGIETKFTRAIRDLGGRFEHRLFLSATPHNGHSNSFATLLELLDPYRFTRGVPVRGRRELDAVMVRRIKEDLRAVQGGFPQREVRRVAIERLPEDAPELVLSRLLDEYRGVREERLEGLPPRERAAAGLLMVGLQQRLLSSIEAFALSLKRHRRTVREQWERAAGGANGTEPEPRAAFAAAGAERFAAPPDADDERSELTEAEQEAAEEVEVAAINAAAESERAAAPAEALDAAGLWRREQALLDRMERVADAARGRPEAKTRELIRWIKEHLCPDRPRWNDRRVLIFTENVVGTKRHLREMLQQAFAGTELAEERIATVDGQTTGANRKELQRRFNTHPARDPLRILVATDAAREGLNFQAHCTDLFHFDLPWNPGRIEQRNGRIDRKLQPAPRVRCHYFALPQRAEDRVLEVLVRKTETIKRELGSLSKVIDDDVERRLRDGIRHRDAAQLARAIEAADLGAAQKRAAAEELEAARGRQEDLKAQIERCRGLLEGSRGWTQFTPEPFRDALSCSLAMQGAGPLEEARAEDGSPVWTFPPLGGQVRADGTWASTLDTLREPRKRGQKVSDWRRDAALRPVVFEDAGVLTDEIVHLHLEQRMAQRLLARFRSQGFFHHDLSRACLVQAADSIPRVILVGRLCLFGQHAERLHEVLTPVAARWIEPSRRRGPLRAYAEEAEARTLERLEDALHDARAPGVAIHRRLLEIAEQDIEDLLPQLEDRAGAVAASATERLRRRGEVEARELGETLERQRRRVSEELARHEADGAQITITFSEEEKRQRQADVTAWRRRLTQFDRDLETEPARIRAFYAVHAQRVEPVGLVYLWPDTN